MADVVYSTDPLTGLYKDHSDIRREAVEHTSSILRDVAKESHRVNQDIKEGQWKTSDTIKDTRHDISDVVGSEADRLTNQAASYYIANQAELSQLGRDIAATKSSVETSNAATLFAIQAATDKANATTALEAAKLNTAINLGHSQLERSIMADGNETRKLINDLKISELERKLIERNADILDGRYEARHWRGSYDNAQFAALNSQLQAFNSQLSATRSDMVNFGTMTGVTSSANTNQVR